jgi:hypothetical protein
VEVTNRTYIILTKLANAYIPKGVHQYLHVDCREKWVDLMVRLIEACHVDKTNLSELKRYAKNWFALITHILSLYN